MPSSMPVGVRGHTRLSMLRGAASSIETPASLSETLASRIVASRKPGGAAATVAAPRDSERDRERVGELFGALEADVDVARRSARPPRIESPRASRERCARHRDGLEHDLGQKIAEPFAHEGQLAGERTGRR